jgi:hypothetical protein
MPLQLLNKKNGKHNELVRKCKAVEILKEAGAGLKDRHFMFVANLKIHDHSVMHKCKLHH